MTSEEWDRVLELCRQIKVEQDQKKCSTLTEELIQLLAGKQEHLKRKQTSIIRQIGTFDEAVARAHLRRVHQMRDHLNAIQNCEVQARKEWLNSSELIFPEDFTEEIADPRPIEKRLKQLDRIEAALNNQIEKLRMGTLERGEVHFNTTM